MTTLVMTIAAGLVLCGVALAAYHHGRRQGRVGLPPNLITELHEHKTRCVGEPADRVALEIRLLCETDSRASP